ncbi:MAG: 23S rRNA (pseudouridine(1915)-N(3))-methyltransferase RlmH [Corallococcus sp.]|nr:23S rRNA (pseudouridine(1915)-N(3))-methyltransferase RlmH [Corallococcus sp.]MCM1359021.1 23S rRNA (pseudouridine(1915)-N(3))-methyltransferase RlmH [Corallococcus sp.]MCM1395010.1 23S rRNA (pseudouridine(1915)-N(3))-methyltransferase RlmH [Corallococcus sp.]
MKFNVVAVGKIKESYFREAVAEYVKRTSRFASMQITEVDECTFCGVPNDSQVQKILQTEGRNILQKTEGCLVALDISGTPCDSESLAALIEKISLSDSTVTFVIGGSHGLSDEVKQRADYRVSFGKITLPHQLFRVVLCEQLYRACTIKHNVPYHK